MDQLTRRCSPVEWRVLRGDTGVRYCRGVIMIESSDLRMMRMPLNHGDGHMPVLGFGTLIPDAAATISATKDALEAGFRHFDCAERYRNARGRRGVAGGTCRWRDCARRHLRQHKVVELQSSARARRTGFRGESRQT